MVIAGLCCGVVLIGICPWHIREGGWESLEVSLVHPWLLGNRGIVHGMPCDIIVKNDAKLGNAPLDRGTGVSLSNAFGLVHIGTRCRRCLLYFVVVGVSKDVARVKRRTALG